jgi:hypothetical protein
MPALETRTLSPDSHLLRMLMSKQETHYSKVWITALHFKKGVDI